jgi:hypothetical protein
MLPSVSLTVVVNVPEVVTVLVPVIDPVVVLVDVEVPA